MHAYAGIVCSASCSCEPLLCHASGSPLSCGHFETMAWLGKPMLNISCAALWPGAGQSVIQLPAASMACTSQPAAWCRQHGAGSCKPQCRATGFHQSQWLTWRLCCLPAVLQDLRKPKTVLKAARKLVTGLNNCVALILHCHTAVLKQAHKLPYALVTPSDSVSGCVLPAPRFGVKNCLPDCWLLDTHLTACDSAPWFGSHHVVQQRHGQIWLELQA